jgi:hypothetical protein
MIDTRVPGSSISGQLRFIRYAFMPNRLRYCGGTDDNRTIFEYGIEHEVDRGLEPLLRKFTGALPYLQLIARANNIPDPFNERVVEAYWIGNELLEGVEVRQLYDSLLERFGKQLQGRTRDWVLGKAPAGARPHHNFHVFDVHSRVGQLENTLDTMDQCRVSWGKVIRLADTELVVERQPLTLVEGKLALAAAEPFRALRQVDGKGFIEDAQPGEWVTVHWSWTCEVIDQWQLSALRRYSDHHLRLANQTL